MSQHFDVWLLPTQSIFILLQSYRLFELKVNFNNENLPNCSEPKYLGVTLDRSLTYRRHLESLRKKLTHASRFWGGLLAPVGVLEQQRCEQSPQPWCIQLQTTALLFGAAVLIPASLTPRNQWHLATFYWMPASYTNRQHSNPCRHPTCWASSQWSHPIFRTPCHGVWTLALFSAHPSFECKCTAPQIETPICTTAQQLSFSDNNNIRAAQWAHHQWNAELADKHIRLLIFIPDTGTLSRNDLPKKSLGPS